MTNFEEFNDKPIHPHLERQMKFVMGHCDSLGTDQERIDYLLQTICVLSMNECMNLESHESWNPSDIEYQTYKAMRTLWFDLREEKKSKGS
jgi:hypothetical protein